VGEAKDGAFVATGSAASVTARAAPAAGFPRPARAACARAGMLFRPVARPS